jgi:uncharacterized protein YoxC
MTALIQACIVIATIGLLAIALMTIHLMNRFNRASDELSQLAQAMRESAQKFDLVAHEARTLMASLRDFVPPVLRVVNRFEAVGQRTADLSSALLEELELPVFTAAAVARGVRSGTSHFLQRVMLRFTRNNSQINGGSSQ